MIPLVHQKDKHFDSTLRALLDRNCATDSQVEHSVKKIITDIRMNGDAALVSLTRRFDNFSVNCPSELEIPPSALENAWLVLTSDLKEALRKASERIRNYHEQEVQKSWQVMQPDGTRLGQNITALQRVGVYTPGGKATYPSSVLMTVLPAKVAGVEEVIMVVPAPNGEVNATVLAAAHLTGVDRVFKIGGAQAVAALAYGTETIPAVDKIVGPGNIYVATAKKLVFGKVGIDMVAGPSEVVVICDRYTNPDWVAMDLFAQAEHDELAQAIAITDSIQMAEKIQSAIARLLPSMGRKSIIEQALRHQGSIIVVESLVMATEVANHIAPEHLELMVTSPDELLDKIRHAGAIFVGRHSAESLGDYCAGPNHVLPTSGTARFSSPLGVYDYQKRSSVIAASPEGANEMAKIASVLARCEGLTAHACSAEYRLKKQPA